MTIDMETIVAKLYLADALLKSETEDEQSEGRALNASCISSLQDALVYEQEDYKYAKNDADKDVNEAALICDDIHEIYLLLSIAYSIAEDEDKATQYSEKAEKKGCDQ
jgi:hypothetical protein